MKTFVFENYSNKNQMKCLCLKITQIEIKYQINQYKIKKLIDVF